MLVGRCSSQLSSHKLQAESKKSQALRMTIVGVLKKSIPNELALVGLRSGLGSTVPAGLHAIRRSHADSSALIFSTLYGPTEVEP